MSGSIEIIIRTLTAFLFLWIFVLMFGKQTISQKTYHLYIASITMGTIAGNLAFNIKIKFSYFVLAIVIMGAIAAILNFIAVKNRKYRKWIMGEPELLILNGEIIEGNLKKIGYSLDTLKGALREKDIFHTEEVQKAQLEINGTLSVLKRPEYRTLTRQDLNNLQSNTPIELMLEGKFVEANLLRSRYTKDWLLNELQRRQIQQHFVRYAVIGSNGRLFIDLYRESPKG
ncbi:uncharacterized membrane protein YcaP (DUF421 family) [Peribacillus deserti]|uniref:Uncharacterized membrane protein YcaP (DUF421 family) n=1 Tax=Peribacillus deserti TaxID=673318 RepID=A0ABS2QL42_9BACI|nr:DUF421 domain-containing protein [Peribacillus deserti]MBM7693894.1 uncharacterized membrane protein YcaP (DUF421 family) [Peribacillus deserti]